MKRLLTGIVMVVTSVCLFSGCGEEEQGHILDYAPDSIHGKIIGIIDDESFVIEAETVGRGTPQTPVEIGDTVTVTYEEVSLDYEDTDYKPQVGDEVHLSVHSTEEKDGNYYFDVYKAYIALDDESSAE